MWLCYVDSAHFLLHFMLTFVFLLNGVYDFGLQSSYNHFLCMFGSNGLKSLNSNTGLVAIMCMCVIATDSSPKTCLLIYEDVVEL